MQNLPKNIILREHETGRGIYITRLREKEHKYQNDIVEDLRLHSPEYVTSLTLEEDADGQLFIADSNYFGYEPRLQSIEIGYGLMVRVIFPNGNHWMYEVTWIEHPEFKPSDYVVEIPSD